MTGGYPRDMVGYGRLAGPPGRAAALRRFTDNVQSKERVWTCRRVDIARHWHAKFKPS